jgi:hypothetical protein
MGAADLIAGLVPLTCLAMLPWRDVNAAACGDGNRGAMPLRR